MIDTPAHGRTAAVTADSEVAVRGLAEALQAAGAETGILVDCDTAFGRTGVQGPGAAADLAELIAALPGVRFDGLFTHPAPADAAGLLAARRAIERRGLNVRTVSVGGSAHALRARELEGVTELRAGTYVYGDRACIGNGTTTIDDGALRVVATVVSRPTRDRAVLDAGSKTLTSDRAQGCDPETYGLDAEYPAARIARLNEEHAIRGEGWRATSWNVAMPPASAVASGPAASQRGARPSATAASTDSASATPASTSARHSRSIAI